MKCRGNAYFRKNTRNAVNVLEIWIGPHEITIAKFCHIEQLTYLEVYAKNRDGDIVRTMFIFFKPYSDNVNIAFSCINNNVR